MGRGILQILQEMVPWPIRKTGMETNLQALEAIDHETTDTRRRTVSGRFDNSGD